MKPVPLGSTLQSSTYMGGCSAFWAALLSYNYGDVFRGVNVDALTVRGWRP